MIDGACPNRPSDSGTARRSRYRSETSRMAKLILPQPDLMRLIRQRQRMGGDRYDEVWNGTYVMSPPADNEHQELGVGLATAIRFCLGSNHPARIFAGLNVSDDPANWTKNYRVPDVGVFLPGNPAEDRKTYWLGGPDITVEIVSRGDRSRKKFCFYTKVGVHELLIVDRNPWQLELFRLTEGRLVSVGVNSTEQLDPIWSVVLPVGFRLVSGERRPMIEVVTRDGDARWLA
jgi:Uma2 family endonuclease